MDGGGRKERGPEGGRCGRWGGEVCEWSVAWALSSREEKGRQGDHGLEAMPNI